VALGSGPGAVEALVSAAGDPHPDVRRAAVSALGAFGEDPAVRKVLVAAEGTRMRMCGVMRGWLPLRRGFVRRTRRGFLHPPTHATE
jgi:HEAT repeat protein